VAKALDAPAVSVTFTQDPPETESIADDPRGALLSSVYCPA
jgi:D-alanyl-D-alanine carboxypeptidase